MQDNEKELQHSLGTYLKQWFYVEYEVWSKSHKSRIDIVIIHKSDTLKNYPIGIEVKLNQKKRGKDLAEWLKQSMKYTQEYFVGYGKCFIITYPQISGLYLNEGTEMHQHKENDLCSKDNNVSTFISQFNVGEMQKYKRIDYKTKVTKTFIRIVHKGQIIWAQHNDIFHTNNYDRLCK